MRQTKCSSLPIIFLLLLNTFIVNAQFDKASPFIQNYDHQNYNMPENQTWAIVKDKNGILFFANNTGVLEFDGYTWDLIEVSNKSVVRSFAFHPETERIYVGAKGEFGYLSSDLKGQYTYTSLLNKLDDQYKLFDDIWQTYVFDDKVVFNSFAYVFIFSNDTVRALKPIESFHSSFSVNGEFYVRDWGKGLFKLTGDSLEFIKGSEQFATERIYKMLPYDDDTLMVISREKGIYLCDINSNIKSFKQYGKYDEANKFIVKNRIYSAEVYKEDQYILGALEGGMIIMNKDGSILHDFKTLPEFQNTAIISFFVDEYKNIWVGTNEGITYLIMDNKFQEFNWKHGLSGTCIKPVIFNDQLYIAASNSAYYLKDNRFYPIENSNGQCWDFKIIQNDLYLIHIEGISRIKNNKSEEVFSRYGNWKLHNWKDQNTFIGGYISGLTFFTYSGILEKSHDIKGFEDESRYFEIDEDYTIWVSHPNKGIYKLILNDEADSVISKDFYTKKNGLPSNTNNYVFKINNKDTSSEIVFGTEQGMYTYEKHTNTFVPLEKYNEHLKFGGTIEKFVSDKNGNIYFQQDLKKGMLILQEDGSYELLKTPFNKLDNVFTEDIHISDSGYVFFSSRDGVVVYNPSEKIHHSEKFQLLIRNIYVNDSLINHLQTNPVLSYNENTIKFTFTSLFFEAHHKNTYSYILKGYDSQWSQWSSTNEKEYTNLPEGQYSFRVKSKNIYDSISLTAQFDFEIKPPWYRSILAYIAYFIVFVVFVTFIVKYRTRKLQKEKSKLENVILKRTKDIQEINTKLEENQADLKVKQEEIKTQNEELEKHRNHLENLVQKRTDDLEKALIKAEESDRLKSAFFANMSHEIRTPMNAIVGFSSILMNKDLKGKRKKELIQHIHSNSNTLLHLIEDIIDVAKIESGQFQIFEEDFSMNTLFNELYNEFTEKHLLKTNVEFKIVNFEKDHRVFADRYRIRLILSKLIDNAFKFTEKGYVETGYSITDQKSIEIYVKDTGLGISDDKKQVIFKRFTKIENEKEKLYRGAGLGLYISKSIAQLLKGDLKVESEINKGSKFTLTIPYKPAGINSLKGHAD